MKNDALDARAIYDPVARQIVSKLRCRRLRVQIDRVQIKRRQNVLMLSVYYRKRAIPLMWICLTHSGSSHYTHWRTLLDYLETILSPEMQVIILADREFGSADRLRYVVKKGWYYAIRLKGNVEFYKPDWGQPITWFTLLDIAPPIGASYSLSQIIMTKGDLYLTALACAWATASDEPWFIATNLPQPIQALKEYRRRFGCEELFSDLKKRGFQWEDSLIRGAGRFSRLLLALALLTVFLLTLARHLRLHRFDLELTSPDHRQRYSLFQTARRWLLRRLSLDAVPFWVFRFPIGYFA